MKLISNSIEQVLSVENRKSISAELSQAAGFIFGPDD